MKRLLCILLSLALLLSCAPFSLAEDLHNTQTRVGRDPQIAPPPETFSAPPTCHSERSEESYAAQYESVPAIEDVPLAFPSGAREACAAGVEDMPEMLSPEGKVAAAERLTDEGESAAQMETAPTEAVPAELQATYSGTCGENLTWTLDEDGTLTISGTGAMTDYNVEYNSNLGKRITTAPWGYYFNSIETVTICSDVTYIGGCAFSNCTSLKSVTIPDSITSIGGGAFFGCSDLTSVTIPDSVTSIGGDAFYGCSGLTSVTIPDSVTRIGSHSFSRCSNLGSVTIPNSVKIIEGYAFYDCDSLTSVAIPNSVMTLGYLAFCSCDNLTCVTIGNGIKNIEDGVFWSCNSLTSITIPDSVINIGYLAFNGCNSLKDVFFNGSQEQWNAISIGSDNAPLQTAAIHCSQVITSGTCGGNLTWMLNDAGKLTISGKGAMDNYNSVDVAPWYSNRSSVVTIEIADGVTSIGDYAFCDCPNLTNVSIIGGVLTIGENAFSSCNSLVCASLPNSLASIGSQAFIYCSSLTDVYYNGAEAQWDSITVGNDNTSLLNANKHFLAQIVGGTCSDNLTWTLDSAGTLTISGTGEMTDYDYDVNADDDMAITTAPWGTYYFQIKRIVIDLGVTSIGKRAFCHCSSAIDVTIPSSVTRIGDNAFSICYSLASVAMPSSVTSIGFSVFHGCGNLTSIHVADNNPSYTSVDGVLFNKAMTTLIQFPEGKSGAYTIPDSVTSIGAHTFSSCRSLTSVTIPGSVTSIGDWAFSHCDSLTSVIYCGTAAQWTKISIGNSNDPLKNAARTYHTGHTWSSEPTVVPATCTAEGKKTLTCSVCGMQKSETIPLVPHSWNDGTVTTPTSCTSAGVKTFTCTVCSETKEETIPALGHDYVRIAGVEPTCTEGGWAALTCSRCSDNAYREYDPLGHAWDEGVVTTAATCTETGVKTFTCKNDASHTRTETISALSHDLIHHEKAVCAGIGWDAYDTCSRCDYTTYTEIAKLGDIDGDSNVNAKDITILRRALAGGYGILVDNDSADFTSDGNVNAKDITVFRRALAGGYGVDFHNYDDWSEDVPASCTQNGSKYRICTICGYRNTGIITKAAHSFGNWVTKVAATCARAGSKHRACTVCGSTETETIAKTNVHTYDNWITDIAASCEADGSKHHICSVCGATETESIGKLGHAYDDWTTDFEATCAAEGSKHRTCSVCGSKETGMIAKTNAHSYSSWITDVAATCGSTGSKHRECTVCGNRETSTIATTGSHSYGSWITSTPATCVSYGSKYRTCSVCGRKDTAEIAKTGHSFAGWVVDRAATSTTNGSKHRDCSYCGYRETQSIPATGGGTITNSGNGSVQHNGGMVIVYYGWAQSGNIVAVRIAFKNNYPTQVSNAAVIYCGGQRRTVTARIPANSLSAEQTITFVVSGNASVTVS